MGVIRDIIREGDAPSDVHLVLEGFACRYKILPNGERQIFAYLVPGDFCDLNVFILKTMDHTIGTLAGCRLVNIPRSRILELCERPAITRAFWWVTLVDESTLREWLVSMGQRDADQRIAHLFCELQLRLHSVGLCEGSSIKLPITQAELADTMGIVAGAHQPFASKPSPAKPHRVEERNGVVPRRRRVASLLRLRSELSSPRWWAERPELRWLCWSE